ncbi:tRNA dihydrouridine synthase DusB [Nitrospirillum sp. BR 11828]|uniref:tRNA dihydrouridine synthase DusB n=1 Tax=Nitrospirillum sp. BR 11828 TaxID=3104325 RepID=UPI002ACAC7E5|nr:tRNA dihydrouridine synthase DusB [Nitrospirillum sp. BR 11828]MDZ5647860.1 tRNA dihydrouridine synthase DusB [Nitrospirillum sp. BR 11828]
MGSKLAPIQVGPITIEDPVILAPMSGVTDTPFRRLVKRAGAGLVVSEMIASQAMIRATRESEKKIDPDAQEGVLSVQLAGCEPEVMAEAAKLCVDRGASIIDINFGCPVKKVVNGYAGSALMKDEPLAGRILDAVVKAVSVPVTLKMRKGWDERNLNAPRLAKIAEECGIRLITVHGRTRNQMYNGTADWAFIRQVKDAVSLPVIANGDIVDFPDVTRCLEESGADGVMIGRGTYGRPWFINQVIQMLRTGAAPAEPTLVEQRDLVLEHYDAILEHYGTEAGLKIGRKHIAWYSKGLPGSAEYRAKVNTIEKADLVQDFVRGWYQDLLDRGIVGRDLSGRGLTAEAGCDAEDDDTAGDKKAAA